MVCCRHHWAEGAGRWIWVYFVTGKGNVCYFLMLQMAEDLEWKATEAIPPTAPQAPENSYRSLRDLALQHKARPFFFCQCNLERLAGAQCALCLLLC